MPPLQHAKLSASSAHRWLNCPGSVEFSSFYPSRDTFYTKEGSLAHALAEVLLKKAIGIDATTTKDVNKVVRRVKQFYEVGTNAEGAEKFTKEMRTFIKDYVDWVLEEFNAGRKQDPNTLILLETKFDLEPYIPEGFGTADVTLLYGDTLHIIDLKYGRGVLVDAYDNPQLMIYALGVLHDVADMMDRPVKTVKMSINQPRRDHVSTYEVYADDLEAWAEDVLKPKARRAFYEHDLEHVPGDWCTFCPAKDDCVARMEHFQELAEIREKYFDINAMSSEDISRILELGPSVTAFIESVKKKALNDAMEGNPPKGWKLVAGRARRRFDIPENEVAALALKAGVPREDLYETKLVSLTQLEKLMKKPVFASVYDGKITKASGTPVLAPESDKRQALTLSAAEDFAEDL